MGALPICSEEFLQFLVSFDRILQELNVRIQLANRRNRPRSRQWQSTISYPASVSDFLAQITINRYKKRSTQDLEKDIVQLQKMLPNKSAFNTKNMESESFFLKFNEILENFRKSLFAYHYRADKDILKEELYERVYHAALKFFNDFMTKRVGYLEPEKISKTVVGSLRTIVENFTRSYDAIINLSTWNESGLNYLKSYELELRDIRSKIENAQKKYNVPENELETLLGRVHAYELKIKNERDKLLQNKKPEKPTESLQAQVLARRQYIEEEIGEDESTDWLD